MEERPIGDIPVNQTVVVSSKDTENGFGVWRFEFDIGDEFLVAAHDQEEAAALIKGYLDLEDGDLEECEISRIPDLDSVTVLEEGNPEDKEAEPDKERTLREVCAELTGPGIIGSTE
ncbi:MAG: hypothetical protein ACYC9Q_14965 [Bacillota bacterium]